MLLVAISRLLLGEWVREGYLDDLLMMLGMAGVLGIFVYLDGRKQPIMYCFKDDVLTATFPDGSEHQFARWVRIPKAFTSTILAQNDTTTLKLVEAVYRDAEPRGKMADVC